VAPLRHKQALVDPGLLSRRLFRVGVPVAAAVTLATVTVGVSWPDDAPAQSRVAISGPTTLVRADPVPVRVAPISRSEERVRLKPKPEPVPEIVDRLFVTTLLNVWTKPSEKSTLVDVLEEGEKVAVSGVVKGEWAEVVLDKQSRWVHGAYLSEEKPRPEPKPEPKPEPEPAVEAAAPAAEPAPTGLSTAPCASGSSVESGLVPNAVAVHRAVCAAFPSVSSYGGVRNDSGAHGTGQALDIMVTGSAGDTIADYVRANAGALGVSEVLWSQKIWTVERGSEGWRYMEDRGSTTANHYDHVHVTVY
jgi:hypothetical protein